MQLQLRELFSVKSVPCIFIEVVFPKTWYGNVDKICTVLHKNLVAGLKAVVKCNDYFVRLENKVSLKTCFNFPEKEMSKILFQCI